MAPTKRILLGLVLGLVAGILLGALDLAWTDQAVAVARAVGRLWLDGLQMTIVPLVFALLVAGVASAAGTLSGGGVPARAIGWFAVLLLFGGLLGGAVAPLLLQVSPVPASAIAALSGAHAADGVPPLPPLGEWLAGFVPVNPIASAAEGKMVPIVLFALLFGLAATRIEPDARDRLTGLFAAIVQAMLVIVSWVLWVAPLGVFALALTVGAGSGVGAAGALLHYVAIVVVTLLVLLAATYAVAIVAGRIAPGRFARGIASAQIVGFSTQSSLASLPAMIAGVGALGVSAAVRDTVLPLAVSLFRITNPAANMAVAVYVAGLSGVALGPAQLVVGAGVAALVSLAAVGLPGQVSFFTTIGPVCLAMGVPIDALPLLLAIETIPDLFRTIGNVTADMAVTRIVGARTADNG